VEQLEIIVAPYTQQRLTNAGASGTAGAVNFADGEDLNILFMVQNTKKDLLKTQDLLMLHSLSLATNLLF
jgi:hypothetical protein